MARQNVGAREAQLAEHLAKIDRDVRTLEHEQRSWLANARRSPPRVTTPSTRGGLKQREDASRKRLAEELDSEMRRRGATSRPSSRASRPRPNGSRPSGRRP
jgi:hypothetical protein